MDKRLSPAQEKVKRYSCSSASIRVLVESGLAVKQSGVSARFGKISNCLLTDAGKAWGKAHVE